MYVVHLQDKIFRWVLHTFRPTSMTATDRSNVRIDGLESGMEYDIWQSAVEEDDVLPVAIIYNKIAIP